MGLIAGALPISLIAWFEQPDSASATESAKAVFFMTDPLTCSHRSQTR